MAKFPQFLLPESVEGPRVAPRLCLVRGLPPMCSGGPHEYAFE